MWVPWNPYVCPVESVCGFRGIRMYVPWNPYVCRLVKCYIVIIWKGVKFLKFVKYIKLRAAKFFVVREGQDSALLGGFAPRRAPSLRSAHPPGIPPRKREPRTTRGAAFLAEFPPVPRRQNQALKVHDGGREGRQFSRFAHAGARAAPDRATARAKSGSTWHE